MVVKKEPKRGRGRPAGDPEDLKLERIAIRVHEDLCFELNVLARQEGVTRSMLVERVLIRLVNDHHNRTLVDKIGRYTDGPPDQDPGLSARGIEYLRKEETKKSKSRPIRRRIRQD
jgi:hypothetical protein